MLTGIETNSEISSIVQRNSNGNKSNQKHNLRSFLFLIC